MIPSFFDYLKDFNGRYWQSSRRGASGEAG
jgi:hypothetical protein